MSERPEWMPSRESLLSLAHNETLYANCGHDYAGEELEEMVTRVAIRAQVAKLEEIIAGQTGHWVDRIKAEIERLRKEIG